MKPLSEYMIKGSFQLRPVTTESSVQCLYEDNQGGQFQLLFSHQGKKPDQPRVFKYLHVKDRTYAYKDTDGNEYEPYRYLNGPPMDKEFEQSRKCAGCGIAHLLKDCPLLMQSKMMPIATTIEGPTITIADAEKKKKSPTPSAHSSPKASSRSPPKSPQKRQILPQSTTNLLKSQVMDLQIDNAKLDQIKDTSMQSTVIIEQVPQAGSRQASHQDAREWTNSQG